MPTVELAICWWQLLEPGLHLSNLWYPWWGIPVICSFSVNKNHIAYPHTETVTAQMMLSIGRAVRVQFQRRDYLF